MEGGVSLFITDQGYACEPTLLGTPEVVNGDTTFCTSVSPFTPHVDAGATSGTASGFDSRVGELQAHENACHTQVQGSEVTVGVQCLGPV